MKKFLMKLSIKAGAAREHFAPAFIPRKNAIIMRHKLFKEPARTREKSCGEYGEGRIQKMIFGLGAGWQKSFFENRQFK